MQAAAAAHAVLCVLKSCMSVHYTLRRPTSINECNVP